MKVRRVHVFYFNGMSRDLRFTTLNRIKFQRNLFTWCHSVNVEMNFFLFVPLAEKQVTSSQLKEHRVVVLDLSETYLKSKFMYSSLSTPEPRRRFCSVTSCVFPLLEGVCNIYSEQRAIRVKRMVDKKRL